MNKILSLIAMVISFSVAQAQERFEFGLGAGTTHPLGGDSFKSAASTGDGQSFWLGYGLDENWAIELGFDNLDFDVVNSKHKAIFMGATYRFLQNSFIHPIAKLDLASFESKDSSDLKTSSMGAKFAAGLEAEFKYISVGALLNFYHISKSDDAADLKNTQALMPAIVLTFHNLIGEDDKTQEAEAGATSHDDAVALAADFKDSDKDGIRDEDDKCPKTPVGVIVNKIGCSEKEKASVRLNVNFLSGKSDLDAQYNNEVENLSSFMKRFPDTQVEIAGHTDSLGDAAKNTALSQKRAEAVKTALVKAGINVERITAKGYGSSRPLAENKTKAGRDQNRRVTADISIEVEKKK